MAYQWNLFEKAAIRDCIINFSEDVNPNVNIEMINPIVVIMPQTTEENTFWYGRM